MIVELTISPPPPSRRMQSSGNPLPSDRARPLVTGPPVAKPALSSSSRNLLSGAVERMEC